MSSNKLIYDSVSPDLGKNLKNIWKNQRIMNQIYVIMIHGVLGRCVGAYGQGYSATDKSSRILISECADNRRFVNLSVFCILFIVLYSLGPHFPKQKSK